MRKSEGELHGSEALRKISPKYSVILSRNDAVEGGKFNCNAVGVEQERGDGKGFATRRVGVVGWPGQG